MPPTDEAQPQKNQKQMSVKAQPFRTEGGGAAKQNTALPKTLIASLTDQGHIAVGVVP